MACRVSKWSTTMHEHDFDRVTRTLSAPTHRRPVLRGLAAAGLARIEWRRAPPAAAQVGSAGTGCTHDARCVPSDHDPCTGVACVDGLCTFFAVDCITGYTCCGSGTCCSIGATGSCQTDGDCRPIGNNPCWSTACVYGRCVAQHGICPAAAFCRQGACVPCGAWAIPIPSARVAAVLGGRVAAPCWCHRGPQHVARPA
jgi:hypothetical protein